MIIVCIVSFNAAWGGWGFQPKTEYHIVRSVAYCSTLVKEKWSGIGRTSSVMNDSIEAICGPKLIDCIDDR